MELFEVTAFAASVAVQPGFFTIQAEYLNQFVGRRAALVSDRGTKIPFTIAAVSYRPERHQIEVDAHLPHQIVGFAFAPTDLVEVQHA